MRAWAIVGIFWVTRICTETGVVHTHPPKISIVGGVVLGIVGGRMRNALRRRKEVVSVREGTSGG